MRADTSHLVDGKYTFQSLVKIDQLRTMFERFSRATGIVAWLISIPDNEMLLTTGERAICAHFHRTFPVSRNLCDQCCQDLSGQVLAHRKSVRGYCPNGLIAAAMPILIGEVHVATLFAGQVLLEKPDQSDFKKRAESCGYDVNAYIKALEAIPVIPEASFDEALEFFGETAAILAEQGLKEIRNNQARKTLADQKRRLDYILWGTNAGTWEWNVQTGETIFNERWAGMIGYSLDELAPVSEKTRRTFCHPDDLKRSDALLQKYFKGESDYYECEIRMRHKNGDWVWVLDRGKVAFWTSDGKPLWMYGTHQEITERKLAEHFLRESEATYRNLFHNAQVGLFRTRIEDGKVLEANEQIARMFGFNDRESFIAGYATSENYVDPGTRAQMLKEIDEHGEITNFEARFYRKDGSIIWTSYSARLFPEKGWIEGVLVDITERKQTAQALAKNEKRLRSITDNARDYIFTKDAGRRYTFVNPAMQQLLGLSEDAILGKTPEEIFGSKQGAIVKAIDDRAFAGEVINETEILMVGGKEWFFNTVQVPLDVDANGNVQSIMGIVRDISDLKQAEATLREREENLRATLNSIGDAVIVADIEGRVVRMNPVACSLTGWDEDEARGRSIKAVFTIIDRETRESVAAPIDQVLADGTVTAQESEVILIARDDTEYHIAESAAYMRDSEGNITGAVLVFRDVTEKYRNEKELQRMQRLESLGTVAGGIAHDFNNLIMGVFGNIEMAKIELPEDHESYTFLEEAHGALESARRLTGQLLTFARGGDPVMEIVDTRALVAETAAFHLSGSNVRSAIALQADLWPIKADKGQVGQVLANLIINAGQAMPDGGVVHIEGQNVTYAPYQEGADAEGRGVQIIIRDEGAGIDPKIIERIFDPYFSTKPGGNGLGLAVAHSIVTKHQGRIRVSSIPDKGTTFAMVLPVGLSEEEQVMAGMSETIPAEASEPLKILLMDDDPVVLKTTPVMLQKYGHTVKTVMDGEAALETYAAAMKTDAAFDLVIMDLTIRDGMGGKEAVAALLKMDPSARVIVSSGYFSDPVMAHYEDNGFAGRLAKPYDIKELIGELSRVMAA
ncbi:MAG: PAS domain S-box protein [Thermodesulfobacteriota bacterium]|nr:PAS domain S-box protein [Thermodesulfobacteriota bacterium]